MDINARQCRAEKLRPHAEPGRWELDPTPDLALADPSPPKPAETQDPRDREDAELIGVLMVIFTERKGLTLHDRKVQVGPRSASAPFAQALMARALDVAPN